MKTYMFRQQQKKSCWLMQPIASALLPSCYLIYFGCSSISVEYFLHSSFILSWSLRGVRKELKGVKWYCLTIAIVSLFCLVCGEKAICQPNKMYFIRISYANYSEFRKGKIGNVLRNLHLTLTTFDTYSMCSWRNSKWIWWIFITFIMPSGLGKRIISG